MGIKTPENLANKSIIPNTPSPKRALNNRVLKGLPLIIEKIKITNEAMLNKTIKKYVKKSIISPLKSMKKMAI